MLCKMHNLTCIKPNILDTRDTRATNLYELFFFQWSTNLPNKLLPRVIKVCITIRTQETEFALKPAKCTGWNFMFRKNGIWYHGWVDVADRNRDSFGRIADLWGGLHSHGCVGPATVAGRHFDSEISHREAQRRCKSSLFIVRIFSVVALLAMLHSTCMICGANDIMLMIQPDFLLTHRGIADILLLKARKI